MRHDGGLMIAFGAGVGCLAAIWNFLMPQALLSPDADVAGTPGALVAVAATAVLCVAGLVLAGNAAGPLLTGLLIVATLAGILGTGLAAWLLESELLVGLMAFCLIGWLLRVLVPRPAY